MISKNSLLFAFIVVALSACGGGGSSSGGSAEPAVTLTGKYEGTYDLGIYQGTISITINSAENVVVLFTGVPCLQSAISEGLGANASSGQISVAGSILGQPVSASGQEAVLVAGFPQSGGNGTLDLNPGGTCLSRIGTLSVSLVD